MRIGVARRNILLNAAGEGLWGLLSGLTASSTVLVVLLRSYGASTVMIGAITAIEIGASLMPQILGNALLASRATRQRRLVAWHFVAILPFLLAIAAITLAAPRWSRAAARWAVLAGYGCYMFGVGVVLAVWFDWLSGVFPRSSRGRAMGIGFAASAVMSFSGGLAAGRLLLYQDRLPVFSMLYLAAALAGTASILLFALIRDPYRGLPETAAPLRLRDMVSKFSHSLSDRNFRRFLAGRILATAGFCIVPFLAVHYTSAAGGSLSAADVVTFGVCMPVGGVLSNVAFGWIGDRRGHRFGIIAGAALQMVAIAILLAAPGRGGAAAVYFTVGMCAGAGSVSHFNMIFETCPHEHRLSHITIANLVLSTGVVFPLLAGVIVQVAGLTPLLEGSLALSGAALLWYVLMVREPRALEIGSR